MIAALVVFMVGAVLYALAWWMVNDALRLLRLVRAERELADQWRREAHARSVDNSRTLDAYAQHASALERYEFGTAMRAASQLRRTEDTQ